MPGTRKMTVRLCADKLRDLGTIFCYNATHTLCAVYVNDTYPHVPLIRLEHGVHVLICREWYIYDQPERCHAS